ncbi:MAG TPA: lipase family protein, partial [Polyangiaceae bacterium]
YRNQRATWFDVLSGIKHALAGESILAGEIGTSESAQGGSSDPSDEPPTSRLEVLYITGHSLGGAMATLAAYKIATDPAYAALNEKLRGVYTYGSPMVGNLAFAAMWKQRGILEGRLFGHVYANDVVPHLPPGSAGDFAHVGRIFASIPRNEGPATPKFKWAETDRAATQVESLAALLSAVVPLVAEQFPGLKLATDIARRVPFVANHGLGYSFYDHSPTHYIDCSKRNEQLTEFGDDF